MIVQIIKFQTELSEDEVMRIAEKRAAEFRSVPGLRQKYYAKTGQPGQFAGIYLWDSMQSMNEYRESELAGTIPQAYKIQSPPDIEFFEVAFTLRE